MTTENKKNGSTRVPKKVDVHDNLGLRANGDGVVGQIHLSPGQIQLSSDVLAFSILILLPFECNKVSDLLSLMLF